MQPRSNLRICILLIGLCSGLPLTVVSQSISPRLVDINNFDVQINNLVVNASVGEAAITTLQSIHGIITQGFLQPEGNISNECDEISLVYFPNPIEDQITLKDVSCGTIITRIELYDSYGRLVMDTPLFAGTADLQLIGLGLFVGRAYGINNQYLSSFKIVKVTNK